MNHHIIKNILLALSLFVFSILVSAIFINFFCFDADILLTSGDKPGFFELEACPDSLNIIFNALIVYGSGLIFIGVIQLFKASSLKIAHKEKESRQLGWAAKLMIIFGGVFLVYLYTNSSAALLITQGISF